MSVAFPAQETGEMFAEERLRAGTWERDIAKLFDTKAFQKTTNTKINIYMFWLIFRRQTNPGMSMFSKKLLKHNTCIKEDIC